MTRTIDWTKYTPGKSWLQAHHPDWPEEGYPAGECVGGPHSRGNYEVSIDAPFTLNGFRFDAGAHFFFNPDGTHYYGLGITLKHALPNRVVPDTATLSEIAKSFGGKAKLLEAVNALVEPMDPAERILREHLSCYYEAIGHSNLSARYRNGTEFIDPIDLKALTTAINECLPGWEALYKEPEA